MNFATFAYWYWFRGGSFAHQDLSRARDVARYVQPPGIRKPCSQQPRSVQSNTSHMLCCKIYLAIFSECFEVISTILRHQLAHERPITQHILPTPCLNLQHPYWHFTGYDVRCDSLYCHLFFLHGDKLEHLLRRPRGLMKDSSCRLLAKPPLV